ncbi:MAG: LuxR C-terminal-related transcriptional regulator [Ferrovibrio sp.]|uniref:helix-turn-helix transcriptional regulator n=1 Tax=Ferrovibrio sp. TaxID=1917215 RepID=UPI0026018235|nr:helix-turn-helix transcriptional regulator [Ferrovibrio sp.]MCW0232638.1 LuxR C-terminal-related transcriptional regulator [Ferrovibrio sp.]
MSHSVAQISPALLEQLYLGAVDEDEIKCFLSDLALAFDASLASFATMDGRSRHDSLRITRWADQRDYVGDVPGYYAVRSPFRPIMMLDNNFGRVMTCSEMVSPSRRSRDVFINEFLRPNDHEYLVTGTFARSGDKYNYFVLNRGQRFGDFDESTVRGLQSLVPHLRTMLRLRNSMVARERHIGFSQTMADRSGDGLVLLDRHGRVHSMNARAADLLAEADGLSVKASRLKAASSEDDAHLNAAFQQLLHGDAPDTMQPGLSLTVRRPSGAQAYRLHVMPLTLRKFLFAGDDVELAVQIVGRRVTGEIQDGIAAQYGLSAAEVRVATHLLAGVPLKQIADVLGNSVNTIRVHRRNLYRKLGVNRHFDMLRLLGG